MLWPIFVTCVFVISVIPVVIDRETSLYFYFMFSDSGSDSDECEPVIGKLWIGILI